MNTGNTRIGQAQGFRISFLSQLHGLRTTDGQSTLLHFLTALVERKFPHVLEFHEELPTCRHAARGTIVLWMALVSDLVVYVTTVVSGQTLEAEVNELSQGLRVSHLPTPPPPLHTYCYAILNEGYQKGH